MLTPLTEDQENLLSTFVEINLHKPDDFLKIKETLTRIGIANHNKDTLFQSVYLLHKRGKYYLVHFKELFMLDGKKTDFSQEDLARRNTIANMLFAWNLCVPVNTTPLSPIIIAKGNITIVPFREKSQWELVPKYTIGGK